jgi:outer membrane protein assembly factor BamB
MSKLCNSLLPFFLSFLLSACAGLGDDNTPTPTPLTSYAFQFQPAVLWSLSTGGGMGKDFLRLGPVINNDKVFVTSKSGFVTAVTLAKGHKLWQANLKQPLTSGPAVAQGIVILASMKPELMALDAESGELVWRTRLPNQVFAAPAIDQGRVVAKTVDGQVLAFSLQTGRVLWVYKHGAPTLVLRPSSKPQIVGNKVIIGFSDGTLIALSLKSGRLLWEKTIAYPQGVTQVDQLVDIAADPFLSRQIVYVVTYHGQLTAISLRTGRTRWQRVFSSYSGLTLGNNKVYVSDSNGGLWAFNRSTGQLIWHNRSLENRGLTAPAIMGSGLVLGDKEGYLHWVAQSDGHLLARVLVHDGASILAVPQVAYPIVCVLTQQGGLSAWVQATMPL